MPDTPLVSVVIPTYNRPEYLPVAVRSVLAQTYRNIEVHVIDDGSTCDVRSSIAEFLKDSRVAYHYQANQGLPAARNTAISHARGEFIGFLDDDDLWLPSKLEKQLPLFNNAPSLGVVYSHCSYIDPAGHDLYTPTLPPYRGRVSGQLLIQNFIPVSTAVVRRECFEKCGFFDTNLRVAEDYDLWLRFSASYDFDYIPEVTLHYRVWPGQMSRNTVRQYEHAIRIMKRFLDQHPDLVRPAVVREAWAHTYVGRGYFWATNGNSPLNAVRDYSRALSYKITYLPAWMGLVKLLVPRRVPSQLPRANP